MLRSLGIVWILLTGLVATTRTSPALAGDEDVEVYYFGLHAEQNPSKMFGKYKPMLSHLGEQVSRHLDRPVKFKLRLVESPEAAVKGLIAGKLHIARLDPAAYVLAKDSDDGVHLLAKELDKGRDRQETVLVVNTSSSSLLLDDLRGKTVAFGDETSSADRLSLRIALLDRGLQWNDFDRVDRAGRHRDVAKAVLRGEHDALSLRRSPVRGCFHVRPPEMTSMDARRWTRTARRSSYAAGEKGH